MSDTQREFRLFVNPYDSQASVIGRGITVATISSILFFSEEEMREVIQNNHTPFLNETSKVAKYLGEGKYIFPAYIFVGGFGFISGSEKTVETGLLGLGGALASTAVSTALKMATQRSRPFNERGEDFWNRSSFSYDTSFPSGHTTLAFSVATVMSHQYAQNRPVLSAAFYAAATLTGLSRMYDDKHWTTDVFVGSIIGYSVTKGVLEYHEKLINKKKSLSQFEFKPYMTSEGIIGLSIYF
ncbi:MAG: phosphatase PAP2 family protein [Candidatus Cloacimonetes bacterium]|nr:phosphatase PAP2 family protein [Candidatus Cloacimonadota bacterium]